ncbi:MAG TPA: TonB family protein [Terriglobales bacterium]|nr:TonB family protein [Terriglobales bacterium]
MALRCLLFTADEGTADPIRQVLAGLGVEGEHCSVAVDAVQKITQESLQIVILDWDAQPEAALLLKTTRERKANERPLTLAIVSDDASVPQALQAGANSILRKPILINQVNDTLTTARDLLRAKESAAAQVAVTVASVPPPSLPASMASANEKTLRAGEFLQASPTAPGGQFETESDVSGSGEPSLSEPVDALKDLEPMAAAVAEEKPAAPPPTPSAGPDEPRGLQWYLNQRAGTSPPRAPAQPSASPAPTAAAKAELLGFDQMSSSSPASYGQESARQPPAFAPAVEPESARHDSDHHDSDRPAARERKRESKEEAQLFAYVTGVGEESEEKSRPAFRLGKGTIIGALVLAACAVVAAPQAPWHARVGVLWGRGQRTVHAWLNPQLVIPAQAPITHEDFGRAGDEYKLPVAENIPDATTDPSQIRVEPVIDPTAKKPNNAGATNDQAAPADAATGQPTNPPPSTSAPAQPNPAGSSAVPPPATSAASTATSGTIAPTAGGPSATTPPGAALVPPHTDVSSTVQPAPAQNAAPALQPVPQKVPQIHAVSASGNPPIPSSLSSQMGSMTPDASGNKAPETALDSIEPVAVPEATERSLLTNQPPIAYPASAKDQQGTVTLQVLIGRDGAVQDAKFMQGSFAFARNAIDGVKQWKFKPYVMNGRPVSVQTTLTMSFRPGP